MIAIAFLLLGCALLSAQVGPRAIGIWGLVLLGVVIFVVLISGAVASGFVSWICARGDLRNAKNARTRTTWRMARSLVRLEAPTGLNPEEVKERDAMEPMLESVKAVFAAARDRQQVASNAEMQRRLQEALEHAANARADATLNEVLNALTPTLPTRVVGWILSFAVVIIQLLFVGILVGLGGVIARDECVPQGCTPATTTDSKACASMVACLSSRGINPSPSPFPCAGTNPNKTTLAQVEINTTMTCDGNSNVDCLNNASVIIANDSNVVTTLSAWSISYSTAA